MPGTPKDDENIEYEIVRFIRRVRVQTVERLASIHPELDYNTFIMFVPIADSEHGIRASQLAEDLHVHKSTISRAVAALEDMKLVVRTPDPDDRRAQLLTAPEPAQELLAQFRRSASDRIEVLFKGWPKQDRVTFTRLLNKLNTAAEDLDKQRPR